MDPEISADSEEKPAGYHETQSSVENLVHRLKQKLSINSNINQFELELNRILSRDEGEEGMVIEGTQTQTGMMLDDDDYDDDVNREMIRSWLETLNLCQDYLHIFLQYGYKSMSYIMVINDEEDLREIEIVNQEDIQKLLSQIYFFDTHYWWRYYHWNE